VTDIEQQVVENARKFLLGLLDRMNIDADIEVSEEDDKIVLDIDCDDTDRLIGRRGQVIDALQHLVGKVSYRDRDREEPRGKPLVVDAGGYRVKHIERLESLADRMGKKALENGSTVELDPMSPHDRRIVHMALSDMEGVTTRSEGEGDDRRILVVPDSGTGRRTVAD
jgi:spoIIIJ-associated protein